MRDISACMYFNEIIYNIQKNVERKFTQQLLVTRIDNDGTVKPIL